MSYPANLVPGAPSSTYELKPLDGKVRYVFLRGSAFLTVQGALSRCRIDVPYYDGSVTRDAVDASTLGRGGVSIITADYAGTLSSAGVQVINGDVLVGSDMGTGVPAVGVEPDEILTMMQQDDNFSHTAPHQNVLAMSYIQYYDAAAAGGNLILEVPVPLFRGESTQIPQFLGSSPPVYTPP
jgi:hypothetical protein